MRFDEIFREIEAFQKRFLNSFRDDFDGFEVPRLFGNKDDDFDSIVKDFESDLPKGEWRVERIDRPGVKGFVIRGYFSESTPLRKPEEILPPLRPEPNEPRKPLIDINQEQDHLKIYIELPGVDEDDIKLEAESGSLKLEAGNFKDEVDLSRWIIDADKIETTYENGVLAVKIPKQDLKGEMV
jgi:HSP20 family molecular chaperone IbpA